MPQNRRQPGPPEFEPSPCARDLAAALQILLRGGRLTAQQCAGAFEAIMTGRAHHGEIGALLALLATRIPTAQEIVGAALVMRRHVDAVPTRRDAATIVDTAGTGGAPKTFNVSTAAAIIAAAAAAPAIAVAKHGNRSRTGRGSAEVLQALGVNTEAGRAAQARCLDEAGICFCFAIHHHPAARHAMPVRMALGFPTIFNLLGPLTNPAGAARQLMGVYDASFLAPVAEALSALGTRRAMVVHSDDGLDELSITAPTTALHVRGGEVREERIDPRALGIPATSLRELMAASLDHAAAMIRAVIEGSDRGPPRDMAILNAAATLVVADAAETIEDGMAQAARAIDSGAAQRTLRQLAELSHA
jgi:anthranilate phosphoribosyltransferase